MELADKKLNEKVQMKPTNAVRINFLYTNLFYFCSFCFFVAVQVLDKCFKRIKSIVEMINGRVSPSSRFFLKKMYCFSCLQFPLNEFRSSRLECTKALHYKVGPYGLLFRSFLGARMRNCDNKLTDGANVLAYLRTRDS